MEKTKYRSEEMLFGVNFCKSRRSVRKRPAPSGADPKVLLAAAAALLFLGLLFIAPQWLLVLIVAVLTAAVIFLVCHPLR